MKRPLKDIRNEHRLSHRDMGDLLGISHVYYGYIENNKRGISLKMAEAIAAVFDLNVSDIDFYANVVAKNATKAS